MQSSSQLRGGYHIYKTNQPLSLLYTFWFNMQSGYLEQDCIFN